MAEFAVRLSAPVMTRAGTWRELPTVEVEAGPELSWQQDIAGGMGSATVPLDPAPRRPSGLPLSEAFTVPPGAHVEILAGAEVVFEGFVLERSWGRGGRVTELRVAGYGASMRSPWLRTDLFASLTCGEVLRTALADLAPWLRPGVVGEQWIDPQIVYPGGMSDVERMTLSAIADQVRQGGDSLGREVWLMVMPGRRVWLVPRVEPREPHYVCPFDGRVTGWSDSIDGFATSVTVEYGTAGSGSLTAAGVAAGVTEDAGIEWATIVTAGNLTSAAALALRDAELTRRSSPAIRAGLAVTRDPATWLSTPGGVPAPYWRPRVGEWVRVGGQPMQPIVAVSVDAGGQTATYELGLPSKARQASVLARDTIARYRQMLAANGGRLR